MDVDFNNLRAQAAYALDSLTKTLNEAILPENEYAENKLGQYISGNLLISTDEIQREMDDLRQMIVMINCVFEKGDPEFKEMMDEIDENGGIAWFNELNK